MLNAFYNRGNAYAMQGQYNRALVDFDEAIRLDGNHADFFAARGAALLMRGEHDRAIADYSEAIRLNPDAEYFGGRGNAHWLKGELDGAIVDSTRRFVLIQKRLPRSSLAALRIWRMVSTPAQLRILTRRSVSVLNMRKRLPDVAWRIRPRASMSVRSLISVKRSCSIQ
jgi:tetratricopeptide (TPR) repeat protein